MNKERKSSKAPQFLWIAVGVMSLVAGLHKTYNHGFNNSYLFFVFTAVAILMYLLRKKMQNNS